MDERCDGVMSEEKCTECQFLFKCIEINAKFKNLDEQVQAKLLQAVPDMPEGNRGCCCD